MKLAVFVLLSLFGESAARTFCGGHEATVCPAHHTCIDLPDDCHPEQGDLYCEGVCFQQGYHTAHTAATHKDIFSCGGTEHRECPGGYRCVDLPDKCDPSKGMKDCAGVCYPQSEAAHMSGLMGASHPHQTYAQKVAAIVHKAAHKTSHVTHKSARHELVHCGGKAMLKCPYGYACVDVPDACNPLTGDVNCPGVCYLSAAPASQDAMHSEVNPLKTSPAGSVATPMPHNSKGKISMCGGLHKLACAHGFTCIDLPDDCHPGLGQNVCPGVCYPHSGIEHPHGAGLKAAAVSGHFSVTPQLSALKEYQAEAAHFCKSKDSWTHEKALWCCQHEKLGCPNPAYVVAHPAKGVAHTGATVAHHAHVHPTVIAQVPKACLYNQCPVGTTTCVPDPHKCSNPHAHCFQYKCEPVGSDPIHKIDASAHSKEGCATYSTCDSCTKKYNWQGEQCAWCISTEKCSEQSKQLSSCMAGARLYANECPVADSSGHHATTAKSIAHAAAQAHQAAAHAAVTAAHAAKAAAVAAAHPAAVKPVHLAPHQGHQGPQGPMGPPGAQPVDANVHAAVGACAGKVPGKSHCEFKLTTGAAVKGICWHNADTKGVAYCSKKFLDRVSHWVASYKACKPNLVGTGCQYLSNTGAHVTGKCVPHNFLGTPQKFNAFVEKSMGSAALLHYHKLQSQLFADEEEEDHFKNHEQESEEEKEEAHYHHSLLQLLDQAENLGSSRSLLSKEQVSSQPAGHKGALLFCASHTSHDIPLWHHAVMSCQQRHVSGTCSYTAVQGHTTHGRCVNGNSGSLASGAHKVKTLYCRAHEQAAHHNAAHHGR